MKKKYINPLFNVRQVKVADIITTSDPQISDDPSDGGQQLGKHRGGNSDWEGYDNQ